MSQYSLKGELSRRIEDGACPLLAVTAFVLFFALLSTFSPSAEAAPSDAPSPAGNETLPSLLYVSDYFSFVGADSQGPVAFALDNNRGRDRDAFQAEHFVVLHEEREGWLDVAGNGPYENSKHDLLRIPDSPFFQFQGTPETGLTITSAANQLTLQIDPIPQRYRRAHERSTWWMGSAPTALTWRDRTIRGRVIYEYLMMPEI